MRTGAIQSNAFPTNEKENLSSQNAGAIPEEAIRISEQARNPLITDGNGKIVHAKALFRKSGDPYSEDRVSVEKSDSTRTETIPDENVMPG